MITNKHLIGTILFIVLVATTNAFGGYMSVGAGTGGGHDQALTLSVESGVFKYTDFDLMLGLGVPVIFHGYNNVPSDTINGPLGHNDYTIFGKEYDGTEIGLYAKTGIELFETGIYVNLLGGFTVVKEIVVSQSNITGWHYEQTSKDVVYGLLGGGFSYFTEMFNQEICFQIDGDNRRGATLQIGIHW